jgi:hypothetical protein
LGDTWSISCSDVVNVLRLECRSERSGLLGRMQRLVVNVKVSGGLPLYKKNQWLVNMRRDDADRDFPETTHMMAANGLTDMDADCTHRRDTASTVESPRFCSDQK